MQKICLTLCEKTLEENLKTLEKYRKYIDVVELRVDKLLPDERFQIRHFPALAGIPAILTIRRKHDGGFFENSETARVTLIANALANAKADRRLNFAYVDMEEDLDVPSLEEAARAFGTRIIRSLHQFERPGPNIAARVKALARTGDEIVKYACLAETLDDTLAVFKAAGELKSYDKILIAMGEAGVCSRILTAKTGSQWTYSYAPSPADAAPPAPGQIDPKTLCNVYRYRNVREDSDVYGILGYPLKVTGSPLFFNTVFSREKMNCVYVPFPSESADKFFPLARHLNVRGVSVTIPHKQNVLKHLTSQSVEVSGIGACNTIVRTDKGWAGYNTDTLGFSDSILHFMGKKNFRGLKITIVGAGGAARAVAYQIWRLHGKAFIVNRTLSGAEDLAEKFGFRAGGLDSTSAKYIKKHSDLIINTTSAGMSPPYNDDPLRMYKFYGHEVVMDLIYMPEQTAFLSRAAAAGCATLNGFDMLTRQARYQYKYFFGADYPEV